jgi:hypothetical protein
VQYNRIRYDKGINIITLQQSQLAMCGTYLRAAELQYRSFAVSSWRILQHNIVESALEYHSFLLQSLNLPVTETNRSVHQFLQTNITLSPGDKAGIWKNVTPDKIKAIVVVLLNTITIRQSTCTGLQTVNNIFHGFQYIFPQSCPTDPKIFHLDDNKNLVGP